MKKIIINADDFGYSKENNNAVKLGYQTGIITSASIMSNMNGFEHAIEEILPQTKDIDLGFHFNIMEGKSLTKTETLCDTNGMFNNSFIQLMTKSFDKNVQIQIEQEFKAQIEKVLNYHSISHVDSHVHIHSIPPIYNIITKLAKEYNIKFIRTQKEIPYIVWKKSFNSKYCINTIKNILLNSFTFINSKTAKNKKIQSNDYFIGVLYTGFMDEAAILKGLNKIKKNNSITEIIFHPYLPESISSNELYSSINTAPQFGNSGKTIKENSKMNNYREFLITQTPKLKDKFEDLGFVLSKYSEMVDV